MDKRKKRNGHVDRIISKHIREWMVPHIVIDMLLGERYYTPTNYIDPGVLLKRIRTRKKTQLKRAARYRLESRLSTDDPNSRHEKLRTLYIVYKPPVQAMFSAKHLLPIDERSSYGE